jgi:hypothetical protein
VFGAREVAEDVVLTFGDQVYVNVPVPPLAVTVIEPLLAPLQLASVFVEVALGPDDVPIVTLAVAEHKFASLTVTVYVPEATPVSADVVAPVFQE